ncbi:TPA: hypothetical protein MD433_004224 [Citrobacter freundii]|nr:hypothetical protein [Citrobacter freundii]
MPAVKIVAEWLKQENDNRIDSTLEFVAAINSGGISNLNKVCMGSSLDTGMALSLRAIIHSSVKLVMIRSAYE